jgi:hypothetical protein
LLFFIVFLFIVQIEFTKIISKN